MASSRKSNLADTVAAQLAPLLPARSQILIGLSGGMDSVVLLHLLHELSFRYDWQLSALHVHHGISPNADAWADFCAELCARHAVSLHVERVDIALLRDEYGIEAAARKLRHAAFSRQDCDFVALAHHADDQAETMLLQLMRGAGVKGAAAMPMFKPATVQAPATLRPLLNIPRGALQAYAVQHELRWVEDESNADESYPRNFLRHRLLPVLEQEFPAYRATLARSAQHFAEAADLLDVLAKQDGAQAFDGVTLQVEALRRLSPQRAKNLLRYFLHRQGALLPQAAQLNDMLRQLCDAREDAAVCVDFGDWQVRRYQGAGHVLAALPEFDAHLVLPWCGETKLPWPALNRSLVFKPMPGQGIALEKMRRAPVTLRLRNGGESLRPHCRAATRSLKNLLQEHHVPPWLRERLPLLYCGDELVCVAGVAVAAEYQAHENEAGMLLSCE